MINIRDVAKKAGVSPATVSLAMNDSGLVNPDTQKRVKKIAEEMGYVSNPYARKLAAKKSGMIGVIIPDIENNFYASFVRYLNDCIKNTPYALSMLMSGNQPELEEKVLHDMINNRMEGIIYIPINNAEQRRDKIDELVKTNIPVICATTKYGDLPYVMSDLYSGMYEITRYIIEKGHRNIAYLSGPKNIHALDIRENGFADALRDYKIGRENIKYIFADEVTYECACEEIKKMIEIEAGARISAVVCVNDIMALGVINTLKRYNISVPEHIAVTGFDNGIFSVASPVPITTIHQDIQAIAEKSIEMLMSLIHKKTDILIQDCIVPVSFIERDSTV